MKQFKSLPKYFSSFNIKDKQKIGRPIYLDYSATTPLDYRVLEKMLPYMTTMFGNPHSRSHSYGWEVEKGIEHARSQIGNLINANSKEIIFTSGATESNNLALKGLAQFYKQTKKNHFVTTQIEHKCVLDSFRHLENEGFEVTYLPVQKDGILDMKLFEESIKENTIAASVIFVHNEISAIQNIEEIGKICRQKKIFLHTDAAQAFGKIPIDVQKLNIDLMSISGHKIYGPKGIGALYTRRSKPRVKLIPIISGGGQERGLRSGTLSPFLCVGLGEAARIAYDEMEWDFQHVLKLRDHFIKKIEQIPNLYFNGSQQYGYPGTLNYSVEYVEGESLIMAMKNVAISSGSACTSASLEPSYVLRAIGVNQDLAHTSLRFGIGRFTTLEEIDFVVELFKDRVGILRDMSPLWEFAQEGEEINIEWTGGSKQFNN